MVHSTPDGDDVIAPHDRDSWSGYRLRRDCPAGGVAGGQKASGPGRGMEHSQRSAGVVRGGTATEPEVRDADVLGQVQRDRVVRAEHLAAALQRVLAQRAGRLDLAQPDQGEGQGGRR
jgi:hypothetical protein